MNPKALAKITQNPLLVGLSVCPMCGTLRQVASTDRAMEIPCVVCSDEEYDNIPNLLHAESPTILELTDFREIDALVNALVDAEELKQHAELAPELTENKIQLDLAGVLSDSFQVSKTDCNGYAELCIAIDLMKAAKLLLARRFVSGKINPSNAIATLQQQIKQVYIAPNPIDPSKESISNAH